jgi:hypothetical protein
MVIDECAFLYCTFLGEVRFAAESKLQYMGKEAFSQCRLKTVFLPGSVTEIDPRAFSAEVWPILKFEGSSPLLVKGGFVSSPDSMTILKCLSGAKTIEVPAHIEVIGRKAFDACYLHTVIFASGSRLREIGEEAFFHSDLSVITVPSSVEILGDRCFEKCSGLATVTFEAPSQVKRIGERAFACSGLQSFTIPASTNEIDGSAFVGCPLEAIHIDPGNRGFIVRGNTLLTSDGTEIVRSFGFGPEIFVPSEVEVLQNLCFESLGGKRLNRN